MRRTVIAAATAACFASSGYSDDPKAVELRAGESVNLCTSGIASCPVSTSICDDPKVAVIESGPNGSELKGVSPGATLCSTLGSGGGIRRVFRVVVQAGRGSRPR